jgi:hypothetical protein
MAKTERRRDEPPSELERERVAQRYGLARMCVPVFWIVALYVPIRAAEPVAEVLAGKNTSLTVTFSVTIAISLVLGGTVIAQRMRIRAQGNELRRLRRRLEDKERQLRELREAS